MSRSRVVAIVCTAAVFVWSASVDFAAGQSNDGVVRIDLGTNPETVLVGQPFRSAVRVVAPAGYRVEFGEVSANDSLAVIAPAIVDTLRDATQSITFTLAAWTAGSPTGVAIPVRLHAPDGSVRVQRVELRLPIVQSVLPDNGEPVEPRPPRGVIPLPSTRALPGWWWLGLILGVVFVGLLGWRLLRRAQGETPIPSPREWALGRLGPGGAEELLRAGDLDALVQTVSWVLRAYIAQVDEGAGLDLTTTELIDRLAVSADLGGSAVADLEKVLGVADRVKFARYRPGGAEARSTLESARSWIAEFPPSVARPAPQRAA